MLSEVVTCSCVRNPGGHAESDARGVSFNHVLRPLDHDADAEADVVSSEDSEADVVSSEDSTVNLV